MPEEALARHGITAEDQVLSHPALPLVCADLADQADAYYRQAWGLMAKGPQMVMRPPGLMAVVYQALLKDLRRLGWPQQGHHLSGLRKAWLALRFLYIKNR